LTRNIDLGKIVPTARSDDTIKIVSAGEAVRLFRAGDTLAVSGFAGIGFPEQLIHQSVDAYKANEPELENPPKPAIQSCSLESPKRIRSTEEGSIALPSLRTGSSYGLAQVTDNSIR
jgi:hypothetical protein